MKINRFETALGRCVEDIAGQYHIGYSMSDLTDFYEMDEYLKTVVIRDRLFLFMITILVRSMSHFKSKEMSYTENLFI